jgi:hypothetical protein
MFRKGVEPQWEDPANREGGEYKLRLNPSVGFNQGEVSLDFLNRVWEVLVQDLITRRFTNSDDIVGVRIVDKSFAGKENFRIEVRINFNIMGI